MSIATLVTVAAAAQGGQVVTGTSPMPWLTPALAIMAAAITVAGGYLVSHRNISRSGARLHANLELLERAAALGLREDELDAIRRWVRRSVERHTRVKLGALG